MIERKRIQKYLSKQFLGIKNNLFEMGDDIDKGKLHELRLHSKKAKAITSFLQESLGKKNKYSITELKELFHCAGNIRTAQLNLETIKLAAINNDAFEKCQQSIIDNEAKELATRKIGYKEQINKLGKRLYTNLHDVSNKATISFYHINLRSLRDNLLVIDENRLHDNRKIIKKLLYNLKLLPASVAKKINVNKDYLDNLQDLIGRWHDTLITLEQLGDAGITNENDLAQLRRNKLNLFETIIKESKEFDSRVLGVKSPG
jgi:CHAD domain-containing protein